eukprot:1142412-Amphidinium_carterae.1
MHSAGEGLTKLFIYYAPCPALARTVVLQHVGQHEEASPSEELKAWRRPKNNADHFISGLQAPSRDRAMSRKFSPPHTSAVLTCASCAED